jgi:tight adherence protein C
MAALLIVLGALLIFLAIAISVLLSGDSLIRRQQVRRSMGTMSALTAQTESTEALEAPFSERVVAPAIAKLSGWGRSISPADQPERVRRRLDLAGNPLNWDVDRVLGWSVLSAERCGGCYSDCSSEVRSRRVWG